MFRLFSIFLRSYCENRYSCMKARTAQCSSCCWNIEGIWKNSGVRKLYSNLGVISLNVRHAREYDLTWVSHIKVTTPSRVIIQSIIVFTSKPRRMRSKCNFACSRGTWCRWESSKVHLKRRRKQGNKWNHRLGPEPVINFYDFRHHNFHILICKLSSWINRHHILMTVYVIITVNQKASWDATFYGIAMLHIRGPLSRAIK